MCGCKAALAIYYFPMDYYKNNAHLCTRAGRKTLLFGLPGKTPTNEIMENHFPMVFQDTTQKSPHFCCLIVGKGQHSL
jgi:hypothetical protein